MKKILLCILDGFGYSDKILGNSTIEAKYINSLIKSKNTIFLKAAEESVGLSKGQFGNSEVGHLTIGSGRILKQKLPLISDSIKSGDLEKNPKLNEFLNKIQNNISKNKNNISKNTKDHTLHIMGLFSKGGVHSDIDHLFWAINLLRNKSINIKAHLFLDGRDVFYKDAINTLSNAISKNKINISEIATIQGRFYSMDRDKKMDRTQIAYDAIVSGKSDYNTNNPIESINKFYENGIYDENIPPIILNNYNGADKNDYFWMLNFRTDRIKQILNMLISNDFKNIMNMVNCGDEIDSESTILFENTDLKNTLGEILSKNNINQLRIAETEKYAHVTYFFNGGKEIQYEKEDRILIKSPNVKDYRDTPDMSSKEITKYIINAIENSSHRVIIANFANADMIGHTGDFEAARKSLKSLDEHIKNIVEIAKNNDYITILTSDHGNAEYMVNENLEPQKAHTLSKVPFIIIPEYKTIQKYGGLFDIAPTILHILNIEKPSEMTGKSLI